MTILDAYKLQDLLDAKKYVLASRIIKRGWALEDVIDDIITIPGIDYKVLVDAQLNIICAERY